MPWHRLLRECYYFIVMYTGYVAYTVCYMFHMGNKSFKTSSRFSTHNCVSLGEDFYTDPAVKMGTRKRGGWDGMRFDAWENKLAKSNIEVVMLIY